MLSLHGKNICLKYNMYGFVFPPAIWDLLISLPLTTLVLIYLCCNEGTDQEKPMSALHWPSRGFKFNEVTLIQI